MNLKNHVTEVANFPKPGILFYDISTILSDAKAWHYVIDSLAEIIAPQKPDLLAAVESRGFLLAAPLAYRMGLGYVMIRKRNKLPGRTVSFTYDLEYGNDTLEVQVDAFKAGQKIVIVDDLLATGGTLSAAIKLVRQCGADVTLAAGIIELLGLKGQARIDVPFTSLIQYP
ncbi:MAG: adenine phosphoribosyltransferase [Holosporales bacterium]|jgi:adenine phosphoribosyltransferase